MSLFRFNHVVIESYATNIPSVSLSSSEIEDRLAPLYERLKIPFGTLERLSGIGARYIWDKEVLPSQPATVAAKRALEQSGLPIDSIGAVFNCSVTRDYFEPATATIIHGNLGLKETSFALDITNACIGFSNGILFLSNLIESGVIKAGIVVSAENISFIINSTINHILGNTEISRENLLKLLPVFTLGCGSAAYVLCHESIAKKGHKILAATSYTASEHNELCSGNGDYFAAQGLSVTPIMYTESAKLIASAAKLGSRVWREASEHFGWTRDDVDHIVCHQVGKQVNEAFYGELGLDISKEFTIYREHGNLVSAALPTTLAKAVDAKNYKTGDKVLLLGYGSGLNAIFTAVQW